MKNLTAVVFGTMSIVSVLTMRRDIVKLESDEHDVYQGREANAVLKVHALHQAAPPQYCHLGESCWPDSQAWQQLDSELGSGVLKKIADVSTVYSECNQSITQYKGATVSQAANGTCIFAAACVYKDCNVSGAPEIPVYSVEARTVEHVQAAVNFARVHHIRVAVKATGASYSVADQQANSILIWMSNFHKFSNQGVSANFSACGINHGPVLKVGGGETWGNVFGALATSKYMASSGAAVTVGGAGGWLQGGGLGPFDRSLGLGVDNVVQFEVVTADGSVKVANACSEPDLFWALRGGGGGNWGVVVSQTSKVHPQKPLVRANLLWMGAEAIASTTKALPNGHRVCLPLPNSIGVQRTLCWTKNEVAHSTVSMWHDVMLNLMNPATMDHRLDGYYGIGCAWGGGFMCADLYFRGTMAEFDQAFAAPLRAALNMTDDQGNAASGAAYAYLSSEYSSYYNYASQDCIAAQPGTPQNYVCNTMHYPSANGYDTDAQVGQGGYESRLSWMLPASLFSQPIVAKEFFSNPYMSWATGHVLGGAMNDVDVAATSVHPSMRSTALEILLPAEMDPKPDMPNIRAILNKYVPVPHSAPIFNHDGRNLNVLTPLGEVHGLNWQQMYWGGNLERLKSIKAAYDPQAIFTCRDCVTTTSQSVRHQRIT